MSNLRGSRGAAFGLLDRGLFTLVGSLLLLGAVGCYGLVPPDRYTQIGLRKEPKPPQCEYQLLSTVPQQPFDELGIIDASKSFSRETAEFMNGIRAQVCAAGGDAALAAVNGHGFYFKATVIKFKEVASR
jgi:hypothetical protein